MTRQINLHDMTINNSLPVTIIWCACMLLSLWQSFFRSAQCQIISKFAEIPSEGSRWQSRPHCRPRYWGGSLKEIFAERKREEKNENARYCLVRGAGYNDARVNALVRPRLRWQSSGAVLYPRIKLRKKLCISLNPSEGHRYAALIFG